MAAKIMLVDLVFYCKFWSQEKTETGMLKEPLKLG